jgi:predicted amidohydrolase YtcJ
MIRRIGLTDAHGHIMQYGRSLTQVSLHGATSIPEVIQRIKTFINKLPAEKKKDLNRVIEGQGFDQTKYPGKAFPTAADLDVPELKGRKIFLLRGKLTRFID